MNKQVEYISHENSIAGDLVTREACGRPGGKWHPGEKCFFPKGHPGKHSWGKPPGIWAIDGIGEMHITSGFKYDQYYFAMQQWGDPDAPADDEDKITAGWFVVGCGATPEELTASIADCLATGEETPEKSLLEFLAAFKVWLAEPYPKKHPFQHYLWHEKPDEEQITQLRTVVTRMPNFGT